MFRLPFAQNIFSLALIVQQGNVSQNYLSEKEQTHSYRRRRKKPVKLLENRRKEMKEEVRKGSEQKTTKAEKSRVRNK